MVGGRGRGRGLKWKKVVRKASVVQDAEVARYDFVLEHGAGWDIDPISVVGDDDDGSL